jgi:hypothetical protein
MFSRLPQVRTFTGTIERDLALFTATLRTNAPVNGWAESFLFADIANRATQIVLSSRHYGTVAAAGGVEQMAEGICNQDIARTPSLTYSGSVNSVAY